MQKTCRERCSSGWRGTPGKRVYAKSVSGAVSYTHLDVYKRQKQISISSGTASVSFNRFGNQRASDRYSFNTDNGEFTETSLYQHQDQSGKIRCWIYSVHVGNWGGMFTRILTFIAALLGAALPLTGYYLWIKRLIKVRKMCIRDSAGSALNAR